MWVWKDLCLNLNTWVLITLHLKNPKAVLQFTAQWDLYAGQILLVCSAKTSIHELSLNVFFPVRPSWATWSCFFSVSSCSSVQLPGGNMRTWDNPWHRPHECSPYVHTEMPLNGLEIAISSSTLRETKHWLHRTVVLFEQFEHRLLPVFFIHS